MNQPDQERNLNELGLKQALRVLKGLIELGASPEQAASLLQEGAQADPDIALQSGFLPETLDAAKIIGDKLPHK